MFSRVLSRRQFLGLAAAVALAGAGRISGQDIEAEPLIVTRMRADLEQTIGGLGIALDFRAIDSQYNEAFRIQINADRLMPVASCFKAFIVPYYLLNTPPSEWDYGENSLLYSTAVHSSNGATGVVLDNVARRVPGSENAIVKFNNFLRWMGLVNGLHTWNWVNSPTEGLSDPRFAPSLVTGRVVRLRGEAFQVDNAFTAADLARGHDFITRGEYFTRSERIREALRVTKEILSIPSLATNYWSPIERVFPAGYTGKDGILPASDIQTGRVVNDAGALQVGNTTYLVAFMSAGESESTAINVLREVIRQMDVYAQAVGDVRLEGQQYGS
jgi:hypothetical protein